MSNKEKREKLIKTFLCKGEFLNLFPKYKEVLVNHKDKELIFYDSGNDYRTTWAIGYSVGNVYYKLGGYDNSVLSDKILTMYPKDEEELKEEKEARKKEREERKRKAEEKKAKRFEVTEDTPDKFRFGQYKGAMVTDILEKDKDYIFWCLENIDGFSEYLEKIKLKQDKLKK